jgi:chromosome segregation ATPase
VSINKIIILVVAGLLSFSISFAVMWFITPSAPSVAVTEVDSSEDTSMQGISQLPYTDGTLAESGVREVTKSMTEKQLENLIYEVRNKIQQYRDKVQELELQEQRIQIAEETLRKDIEKLNHLRAELATIVTNIKTEQDKLQKSMVEIASTETTNLRAIASTYNRMEPTSASKILLNMSKMQTVNGQAGLEDVVKILHYMEDRNKANLLAELSSTEPQLAAILCQRLKQIVETK